MARYLQVAEQVRSAVDSFLEQFVSEDQRQAAAIQLGHIVNLSVRCNPRPSQGVVRRNIVAKAMENHCKVAMTKEADEKTGREYNKISILSK